MTIRTLVAAALTLGSVAIVPTAEAQRYGYGYPDARYEQPYRDEYRQPAFPQGSYDARGDDPRGYYQDRYDQGGRGYDARGGDPRFYDGHGYRRCSSGTTGAIIGALAGGLLGHAVAGRGDHALGTVLGAGAGALAGHAVERSDHPGYCR